MANEYCDRYNYRNHVKKNLSAPFEHFVEGAQWADTHPQSPWISVSDYLPTRYKQVLILFYARAIDGSNEYDSCAGFYNGDFWVAVGYNVQNARINSTVTHWMLIPAPPQKGGQQ